MSLQLRQLELSDRPALQRLLDEHRFDSIFVASRVGQYGIDLSGFGCEILGLFRGGRLVSALHMGANLVPVGGGVTEMETFARYLPATRRAMSIMGAASLVGQLYEALSRRYGRSWANARDIRSNQPVLAIDQEPMGVLDERVQPVAESNLEAYFAAAVKMYSEEVGISPLDPTNSYRGYVKSLLRERRAFGAEYQGNFWFKTDVGAHYSDLCQVQGVWLEPAYRGRGLATPAFAQAIHLIRQRFHTVSLYVNDYNTPALRVYARIGMRQVSTMATVLY